MANFLLLRMFVPFSVIIVLLIVSLVSLFIQLVVTIFECVSFVDEDDEEDDDDIIVVEEVIEEVLLLLLILQLLLILEMADDEDDVSNERGNTWGFKGKSKFDDLYL